VYARCVQVARQKANPLLCVRAAFFGLEPRRTDRPTDGRMAEAGRGSGGARDAACMRIHSQQRWSMRPADAPDQYFIAPHPPSFFPNNHANYINYPIHFCKLQSTFLGEKVDVRIVVLVKKLISFSVLGNNPPKIDLREK
jgi:hypothetical protein